MTSRKRPSVATDPQAAGQPAIPQRVTGDQPTAQEIRAAVRARMEAAVDIPGDIHDDVHGNIASLAIAASDPLVESGLQTLESRGLWEPLLEPAEDTLWTDLRPSEAVALSAMVHEAAYRAADRCWDIILEELTAAGVAFAAAYPAAPRREARASLMAPDAP